MLLAYLESEETSRFEQLRSLSRRPEGLVEIRRPQPNSPEAEAPCESNEPPAPVDARRHRRSRSAPPFSRDPKTVVFQACITLTPTETEITMESNAPSAPAQSPKTPFGTEWAIRSRPKPEDLVWNRTALISPRPKSLRAEHLRSPRQSRSSLGPNERLRWPRELPRLQGFVTPWQSATHVPAV
jgi:hypothetical protein